MVASETLRDLGWPQVLRAIEARCHTVRGAARAGALTPELSEEEARHRAAGIAELRKLAERDVRLSFAGISDVDRSVERATKGGVLGDEELVSIGATARGLTGLWRQIRDHEEELEVVCELVEGLADLSDVGAAIDRAYGEDGRLADHASESLGGLRRRLAAAHERLHRRASSLIAELGEHLQDSFVTQRGERYVVPVRAGKQKWVPGIVHDTSQSGQTLFVEPAAIVELGNEIKIAACAVDDEELRIRAELSRRVAGAAERLASAASAATEADLIAAAADFADRFSAVHPRFDAASGIRLIGARHPLLVLAGKHCVPNDVTVDPEKLLLISGPNAGGKTVALKTVGLAALMARCGLHILAAAGSSIRFYDDVFTEIGDAQSLEDDLSTFSGHLASLRRFLDRANENTLVLIDEICVGTEPEQGACLAQAVLEALAARRVTGVVTSHYERLKELAASDDRFANSSVGFDMKSLGPTFVLHLGVPGSSGALVVAKQLGLGATIVDRAEALIGAERVRVEELLLELGAEKQRIEEREAELGEAIAAAERERARAELARAEARAAQKRAHEGAHGTAVSALREARVALDRARTRVRVRSEDRRAVEKEIDSLARKVREHAPRRESRGAPVADEQAIAVGMRVFVESIGGHAVVEEAPTKKGVVVRVGAMRMTVPLSQLSVDGANAPAPAKPRGVTSYTTAPAIETPRGSEIDLRGARVEEAIDLLDRAIDGALTAELSELCVIHGHGTGALRKAVRSYLREQPAVSKFRAGERSEGGDGVTLIYLGD